MCKEYLHRIVEEWEQAEVVLLEGKQEAIATNSQYEIDSIEREMYDQGFVDALAMVIRILEGKQ